MRNEGNKTKAIDIDTTNYNENDKVIIRMLTALETEDGMTDWEKNFVIDISDKFISKGYKLSYRQFNTLEKIYSKFN